MKKLIILVLILIVIILGFWKIFYKKNNPPVGGLLNRPISRDEIVKKNDFEILVPSGWREINPMANGVSMSAWDEKISADENAKKINYHVNFNVTFGKLDKKILKEQIKTVAPDVKFSNETETSLEAELAQQGVEFKALISIIKGKNDDVWNISFNAPKSEYEKYKPVFDRIASSFRVK